MPDNKILKTISENIFPTGDYNKRVYTKNKEGILSRFTLSIDPEPYDLRKENDYLGKMIFKKDNQHLLGDFQVEDFEDFFRDELSSVEKYKADAKFTVPIPDVETALKSDELKKYVLTDANNYSHFDKVSFVNDIEKWLSHLKEHEEFFDDDIDMIAGIPLDNKNRLTDTLEIELHIPEKEYENEVEGPFQFFVNTLSTFLINHDLPYHNEFEKGTNLDNLSKEELFKKWNEKNVCSLPISIYEHSGITVHSGTENTLPVDGVIYISKDNEEVLDYMNSHSPEETASWCKRLLENEVQTYADYLEGQVYAVNIEHYNEREREWISDSYESNVYRNNELSWEEGTAEMLHDFFGEDEESVSKEEGEAFIKAGQDKILSFFFEEAKSLLPEYENNPLMAYKTQLLLWKQGNKADWAEEVNSFVKENSNSPQALNFLLLDRMEMPVTPDNIHSIALNTLPQEDINYHESDLYLASSHVADRLIEKLDKSTNGIKSGMITTFTDQITGRKSYDLPFCALEKHIKERQLRHEIKIEEIKAKESWNRQKSNKEKEDPEIGR